MKLNKTNKKQAGLTLIEITLVIAVLLGLISVLFIGVSAYKEGSNRAKCILNISSVQKAVRSYQNLYELEEADALLSTQLIGPNLMIEAAVSTDFTCPVPDGVYSYQATVPPIGTAYLDCSLAGAPGAGGQNHVPTDLAGW